jgi:hypothetical protein
LLRNNCESGELLKPEDDILFQWRLRRRIEQVSSSDNNQRQNLEEDNKNKTNKKSTTAEMSVQTNDEIAKVKIISSETLPHIKKRIEPLKPPAPPPPPPPTKQNEKSLQKSPFISSSPIKKQKKVSISNQKQNESSIDTLNSVQISADLTRVSSLNENFNNNNNNNDSKDKEDDDTFNITEKVSPTDQQSVSSSFSSNNKSIEVLPTKATTTTTTTTTSRRSSKSTLSSLSSSSSNFTTTTVRHEIIRNEFETTIENHGNIREHSPTNFNNNQSQIIKSSIDNELINLDFNNESIIDIIKTDEILKILFEKSSYYQNKLK